MAQIRPSSASHFSYSLRQVASYSYLGSCSDTMQVNYQNPNKLPLNQLKFHVRNNGVKLEIAALDKQWIENRPHPKYFALPTNEFKLADDAVVKEWLTEAEWFDKEIQWMLSLEHFRFWSYLVYDPGFISSVISFLQEAVPSYIPIETVTADQRILKLYASILRNVLAVLCRMVTNKESESEWITADHLAELLYGKFLISLPMLLDVLVVYGRSNAAVVKRLIECVIKIQPKYQHDLTEALIFTANAFDQIESNVNKNEDDTLDDLALYTLDCAFTIHILLNFVPGADELCRKTGISRKVTHFYDKTIPMLYKNLSMVNRDAVGLKYLKYARFELLTFIRDICKTFLDAILAEPTKSVIPAEELIAILQEALSDHGFCVDYQRLYPVQDDMDILKQACPELDMFKVNFIVEAYTAESPEFLQTMIEQSVPAESAMGTSVSAANSSKPLDPIEKEVQNVLDVLPHLDATFVRKLLTRYENTESAIAAVLEGNLPPDLENNTEDEAIPANPIAEEDLAQLVDRVALYDAGDATRVITKQSRTQNVRPRVEKRILDDKRHVRELQNRYTEYGYITDDDYNDEYDDSYDALAESETKSVQKILRNTGALNNVMDNLDDSDDDEDTDAEEGTNDQMSGAGRNSSKDFCENPELIRERWARNRQAKFRVNTSAPTNTSNVIGKPKGQGQEKSTVVNRHKKDVNKSTRANHNRRQGAAFKRNRGMIPS